MAKVSLSDISKKMRKLDICMISTVGAYGHLTSRPMSNNGDVEYEGNSLCILTVGKFYIFSTLR